MRKTILVFPGMLLIPFVSQAASNQISGITDTTLLIIMGVLIALLLAIIYALAKTIEGISQFSKVKKEKDDKKDNNLKIVSILLALVSSIPMQAQAIETPKAPSYVMSNLEFWLLTSMIVLLFLVIGFLFKTLNVIIKLNKGESFQEATETDLLKSLSLTDNVPLEEEVEIMLDHEYDGIRELDNNLPPWWKYMFYATIVFAFIYIFRFHISGNGKLQGEEYAMEMEAAVLEKATMMADAADAVTEDNVVYLVDAPSIQKGAAIFKGNCATCHGQLGEGGAGPNLTDQYWLHGGNIKNVFKSIKYGIPAKGMIAWQTQFNPTQMQQVASYVLSLQGSNPPNSKAPQGQVYVEEVETVGGDTATIVVEIDQ